jgi:tetratricopeptide (TPR) repeat protein
MEVISLEHLKIPKMKKTFTALTFCLLLTSPIFSQKSKPDELQSLYKQIPVLLEQDKLDEVIVSAERIVEIEKQGGAENMVNYSTALMNLALWRKQRLLQGQAVRLDAPSKDGKNRGEDWNVVGKAYKKASRSAANDFEDTMQIFEQLIKILQTEVKDPPQLATAQSELAALYCMRPGDESLDQAENLFLQALDVREKSLGGDSDSVLTLVFKIAVFYYYTADFEKFVPLAERYISATEARYGKTDKRLVPALRLQVLFFAAINRTAELEATINRIASITGQPEAPLETGSIVLGRGASKLDTSIGGRPVYYSRASSYTQNPTFYYASGTRVGYDRDLRGNVYRGREYTDLPSINSSFGDVQMAPPIRRRAVFVAVSFTIDAAGQVAEVFPQTADEKLKKKVVERVKKWKFKPFVYKNQPQAMSASVNILCYI